MQQVYMDHAATTPLDERVFEVMAPYLKGHFGNASSVHRRGRKARFAVEESRERVGVQLGAEPGEIIFTSGGTEADNLAIKGVLNHQFKQTGSRGHLITSAAEHEAVLRPAEALRDAGWPVTILEPADHGAVTARQVAEAMRPETVLVSIMHANNETGVLSPIDEIAALCREHDVLLHCDAVQTAGLLAIDVEALGVDLLSLSGHKFYGPKGVGVLYVRGGVDLDPLIEGGSQERKRRGGTENVAGVVGCAEALALAVSNAAPRAEHLRQLQHRLVQGIRDRLGQTVQLNTPIDTAPVAPHVVNIAFPPQHGQPMDGEMLLLNLDMAGVQASAGSACTSGALEPSHVLDAMGLPRKTAAAAVRFSMGKDTTAADVDYALDTLATVVHRMRRKEARATP
jgi:cysteine desulfurase